MHQNDTRRYHVQHLHSLIYANEYTDLIQEASLVVAFQYHCLLWKNGMHFLHLYICLIYNNWHRAPSALAEYFLILPLTLSYKK